MSGDELTDGGLPPWNPFAHIGVWNTSLVVPCGPDSDVMRPLTADELSRVADLARLARREQRPVSDPDLVRDLYQYAVTQLDQWDAWQLDTPDGPVYVEIRRTPGDAPRYEPLPPPAIDIERRDGDA
jgi:hypothetical protein